MTLGSSYSKPLFNFSASNKQATLLLEDSDLASDQEPTDYTVKKKPTKSQKASGTGNRQATLLNKDLNLVSNQEPTDYSAKKKPTKGKKTSGTKRFRGIRIAKGQVALRVPGYKGVQKVSASQLVRFVPLVKLKTAAKRILKTTTKQRTKNKQKRKKGKTIQ